MSFLDKALGTIGLQRAKQSRSARPMAIVGPGHAFAGAQQSRRFSKFHFGDDGPNAALVADLETLRARSRQYYRDHPWVKSAVDKLTNQLIGAGRKPRFSAKSELDRAAKDMALEFFDRVSGQIDATRTCDFYGMQELAVKAALRDGETFARFRRRRISDRYLIPMQVQLLEADQLPLSNPAGAPSEKTIASVEFDSVGAPVAYHFLKEHPRDSVTWRMSSDMTTRVPFDEVAHLFMPSRPGQRRGEPLLHAVIVLVQQLSQYQEAELGRKVLAASFGGTIETLAGLESFPGAAVDEADEETGTMPADLEPDTVFHLQPGEKFTPHKSDDIPQAYAEFYGVHGRQLAAAAHLTYGQTTGDYSGSNYSSERAGENCVRRMQTALGKRVDFAFNQPIWMEVMRWGHITGALRGDWADPEYRRQFELIDWQAPAFDWIDPLKDAEADQVAWEMGVVSLSQIIRERGGDPDETFREIAEERKRMKALGIEPPTPTDPATKQKPNAAPPRRDRKELVQ